jgi:CDP-diacylglycerol--glycerol-3-phosphate 3-phosphatidyltransferase/cardiolipin synthase
MPSIASLTAADLVSLSRLALAGAFMLTRSAVARLALIVIAGITDYLDGWLARRRNEPSAFGAVIDPAADRAFVVIVVGTLLVDGTLTPAQTLVLMSRDIVTTIGVIAVRTIASLRGIRLEARFSGKVVTALQFAALVGAIADRRTIPWLLGLVALASAISIVDYSAAVWRTRAVALAVALTIAAPMVLEAQGLPGGQGSDAPSTIRVEGRVDAFNARVDAVHAGIGVAADAGTYFRLAGIVGAGVATVGSTAVASGRVEAVGRFVLDPFRQSRWGVYGGGGVVARYDDGRGTRGYLTLLIGAELPGDRPAVTAVELGIGGGVRLGVAIRQGRRGHR